MDDNRVWSKAYMRITNNPGVYEGHIEFHHIRVQLIFSNEPLLFCSPLPDWLCKKWCIYEIDNINYKMCIWRCLIISERMRCNQARPAVNTMRDALNLALEFYKQPNLQVSDVRPTNLIDFENIALRFRVKIRLYESIN